MANELLLLLNSNPKLSHTPLPLLKLALAIVIMFVTTGRNNSQLLFGYQGVEKVCDHDRWQVT